MSAIIDEKGASKVWPGSITQESLAHPYYLPKPQTWQDVKASRALNTTYTNDTRQPIKLLVALTSTVVSVVTVALADETSRLGDVPSPGILVSYFIEVPAGETYMVNAQNGAPTVYTWKELR